MKGLLPLRLSSSCSSLTSGTPSEERIGAETENYFPEQLVQNLEMSGAIFAAKNMSAGVPLSTSLSFIDEPRRVRAPTIPYRPATSPTYHQGSPHIPSLVPIVERDQSPYHFDHTSQRPDDATDTHSVVDTEGSGGAAASYPIREQSIMTAATSLTSEFAASPLKSPSPLEPHHTNSWMDDDSDDEASEEDIGQNQVGFLSPRPPTPPDIGGQWGPDACSGSRRTPIYSRMLHRRSQSLGSPFLRQTDKHHFLRRSPSAGLQDADPPQTVEPDFHRSTTTFGRPVQDSCHNTPRPRPSNSQFPRPEPIRLEGVASLASLAEVPATAKKQSREMEDDESFFHVKRPTRPAKEEVFIKISPPPTPPPTVQHLLTGDLQLYQPPTSMEEIARAVPLPPDVIETLRVSVTLFPETMLLTSSLTLETIRAYGKKLRHPHLDLQKMTLPDSPRQISGKLLWKKVSSYRKGNSHADRSQTPTDDFHNDGFETVAHEPNPWVSIKSIFGCASDYVCDALYAHILAYNYISTLLPAQSAARRSLATQSGGEDIPKKALSLLGISDKSSTSSSARSIFNRRGSQTGGPQAMSAAQEATLRDIQVGLLRCITGLVATARLMVEDKSGEEVAVLASGVDVDVFLLRSLCEVVRLSEDAA